MKKAIIYSFLVALAACASPKKIQKAAKTAPKTTTSVSTTALEKPLVVAIKSRYLLKDSATVRIFMEFDIENLSQERIVQQLNDHFRFSWLLQPDYGVRERLGSGKIELNEQNVSLKEGKILINFEISRPKNLSKGLLLTEVFQVEDNKKSNNDLVIDFHGTRINDRFGIYIDNSPIPIFRNFINKLDSFQLKSVGNHAQELFLIRYKNDFTPAQSPMAVSLRPSITSLSIEETIKIQTNTPIKLDQEGLYQIVEDTNLTNTGFGFMLVDEHYPRLARPENLINPLIYMSTSQELRTINENPDSKQALDKFFLAITGGNQVVSKKIIKNYYHRIEEANRLFTSYKEGWKTDKGMVYTILGSPNKVQRSRDREVWVYTQSTNFSEIIFTFNKKPNQFTENYYELVRYPEYQAYWFPFVEAWRTGNVVE